VPNPRSLVGKLLLKAKKKQPEISSPTPTNKPPPTTTTVDPKADDKIAAGRQKVQEQVDLLGQRITALHYGALKTPLDRLATTLRAQMSTLDTLPDVGAKATRLMQVGEACGKVMQEVLKAGTQDTKLHQAAEALTLLIQPLETLLSEITVQAARGPLSLRLQTIKQAQIDAVGAIDLPGLLKLGTLAPLVTTLSQDATVVRDRMIEVAEARKAWADDVLDALKGRVKGAPQAAKTAIATDVTGVKTLVDRAKQEFDAANFDASYNTVVQAYNAYDAANKRLDKLINMAELKTSQDSAKVQQGLLASHTDFKTAFEKMKQRLDAAILRADPVLVSGEGVDKDVLFDMVLEMGGAERSARQSLAEYGNYKTERTKTEKLIAELKKHKQAAAITAEIQQIEAGVIDANQLGPREDGGWHRAKIALLQLNPSCAKALALADKLETAKAQLPALTQGLETKGVKKEDIPKLLHMAHKLLVEEGCSVDDAVDMAQSAGKFTEDGLDEPDALVSSRLKHSLMKGDDALTKEHAHAVGRSVRCRGSATLDDVKCVAQGMKRMSATVLDDLNDAGITTGICQGPVTDMIPELCDVNPRGWGSQTWDAVPGVYMGDKRMVVVGTMDDGGKRKVPGPGEGPVQHGTPDLLGHEAGHAYDVVGGVSKRNHVKFVNARAKDLVEPTDVQLKPGRDDYFMTKTESPTGRQSSDDAARSESFAESFALHFANNTSKWPNLKAFWETNPWNA
jgi:hypothetical protein